MEHLNAAGPQELLRLLESEYLAAGFPVGRTGEADDPRYRPLVVPFDGIGEEERLLRLELCFLPHMEEAEAAGIAMLQSFATIAEGVPPGRFGDLLRLAARLNTILPLGAFGLFEDTGVVYYKHNALLLLDNGSAANVKAIDAQNGLILHLHQLYMEAFIGVAEGRLSAGEALDCLFPAD
ncbi:type III secretion system chaperone family protein [Paenibacillus arenilitoris]|uniref:Uncharacterized protein n=1 Tax=Paenibacillus arenilitoris TaxID=2772299 RepID=A0A927H4R7_9BACL|nr:hypothetical protein [Paenibacillus arenilitoris]MBD2868160.1 hypothetical protein [Paenibacillus arenilitoris]